MPAIIATLFWNYALPWLLQKLVDEGVVTVENATGIKTVTQLVDHLKTLKAYSAPPDFPPQVHAGGV